MSKKGNVKLSLWTRIWTWLIGWFTSSIVAKPIPVKNLRKPYDSRRITKEQFDLIVARHAHFMEISAQTKGKHHTLGMLTDQLNHDLQLDKSQTVYSRIWSGHTNRDSLPD